MGWGWLGKIGKAVAPIAASFIPGVGPIVGPMLGAALNSGGGGRSGGLGPSQNFNFDQYGSGGRRNPYIMDDPRNGGIIGSRNTGDMWGTVGQMAGSIFSNMARNRQQQPQYSQQQQYRGLGPRQAIPRQMAGIMPPGGYGYNQNPMNQLDQRNPNLAQSIFQGRQEAMMNQPWRDPNFDRMQGMQIYPQVGF